MPTSFRLPLLCCAMVLISLPLFAEDEPVIAVNPVGEPKGLTKGNAIRYFLWYDAKGWHLQTDTGGKRHVFNGTITVVGGKVTAIYGFENLEAGKKKKNTDLGVINKARNQITFKFATSKKRDGFSFQVDEAAKEIRFQLLIDGRLAPDRVLIGAASQPAPGEVLVLPAHPK